MSELSWQQSFKPEVQKNGKDYFDADSVVLSVASDTAINGFIKGTAASRVSLISTSIGSDTFFADCSCPASMKGQLCKHIWAVLLMTEKKHPDFLDSKRFIEKSQKTAQAQAESPHKIKQTEYKKLQSEKQKLRAKQQRLEIKEKKKKTRFGSKGSQAVLPGDVSEALEFFAVNGFSLDTPIDENLLKEAKKTLSRVFHPDKGGSHEEASALNHHFEILAMYAGLRI